MPVTDKLQLEELERSFVVPPASGGYATSDDGGYATSDDPSFSGGPAVTPDMAQQLDTQGTKYRGNILPLRTDMAGKIHFDPNAGVLGSLISGLTAPGDVYTGQVPVFNARGNINPEMNRRAADMAGLIAMPSPGAMQGGMAPRVGPTAHELEASGGRGYDAVRYSGLEFNPQVAVDTANRVANELTRRGYGADVVPELHSILGKVSNPPPGAIANSDALQAIRSNLTNSGKDRQGRAAAGIAVGEFDKILENLTPPNARFQPHPGAATIPATQADIDALAALQKEARQDWAGAQRVNKISGELDAGVTGIQERGDIRAAATHSGMNLDNALRQEVLSFLKNKDAIRGFSAEELKALKAFAEGNALRSGLRMASNAMGGGGGLGALATGFAGVKTLGNAIGSAVPVVGMFLKNAQNTLASRELEKIQQMIAQRSPLGQTYRDATAIIPGMSARDAAVFEAVAPGLLGGAPRPEKLRPYGVGPVI
jgi:hypothetical protein